VALRASGKAERPVREIVRGVEKDGGGGGLMEPWRLFGRRESASVIEASVFPASISDSKDSIVLGLSTAHLSSLSRSVSLSNCNAASNCGGVSVMTPRVRWRTPRGRTAEAEMLCCAVRERRWEREWESWGREVVVRSGRQRKWDGGMLG
jgi:hypothetical protein